MEERRRWLVTERKTKRMIEQKISAATTLPQEVGDNWFRQVPSFSLDQHQFRDLKTSLFLSRGVMSMIETTFNGFFILYYCNSINILNIATIVNIIVNILKSFEKKMYIVRGTLGSLPCISFHQLVLNWYLHQTESHHKVLTTRVTNRTHRSRPGFTWSGSPTHLGSDIHVSRGTWLGFTWFSQKYYESLIYCHT